MKRSRAEELPYSSRTGGIAIGGSNVTIASATTPVPVTTQTGHHRLLTQHAPIQYQVNTSPVTGVLKNANTTDNIVTVPAPGPTSVQFSGVLLIKLQQK